jgi:hypothetical protein
MGEIADDHYDRMFDDYDEEGYHDGAGYWGAGRASSRFNVTCQSCRARNLKWGTLDGNWRLYENKRGEHNRLMLHACNPPSIDDFDVVEE